MSDEISTTIRIAINTSGEPLTTIAKQTGVEVAALTDFMDGADLHLTTASKIAAYLGLELTVNQRTEEAKKRMKEGRKSVREQIVKDEESRNKKPRKR